MKKTCSSFKSCIEKKSTLFEKDGYPIKECIKCGHRYTEVDNIDSHVKKVYTDDYFFAGKQGYPNYLNEKDILVKYGNRYSKIISKYTLPGKVLDVGCAAGFILKGFEQAGWKCYGIEPNKTMVEYGRKELNLQISTGVLENFDTAERFDLINLIQVIGHFTDLNKALLNTSNLLNKNGLLLIESWDMKSTIAKLLGKHWHEYSPPSVINWFSDKTLSQLFNHYGFTLIAKGRPPKKISIKHCLSLFDEKTPRFILKKKILAFFSNIIGKYNITYPPLDVKWYLFKML